MLYASYVRVGKKQIGNRCHSGSRNQQASQGYGDERHHNAASAFGILIAATRNIRRKVISCLQEGCPWIRVRAGWKVHPFALRFFQTCGPRKFAVFGHIASAAVLTERFSHHKS
jgi:hypothetical protein